MQVEKDRGVSDMPDFYDYTGCKVIVCDESKKMEGETVVTAVDKDSQTITVNADRLGFACSDRVSVLILCSAGVFEYKGSIRRQNQPLGHLGIALYKGRKQENRKAVRYPVRVPAEVAYLVVANQLVPLDETVPVMLLNISTEGALIQASAAAFHPGATFLLRMQITEDSQTNLNTSVVRVEDIGNGRAEYGCIFNFQY